MRCETRGNAFELGMKLRQIVQHQETKQIQSDHLGSVRRTGRGRICVVRRECGVHPGERLHVIVFHQKNASQFQTLDRGVSLVRVRGLEGRLGMCQNVKLCGVGNDQLSNLGERERK